MAIFGLGNVNPEAPAEAAPRAKTAKPKKKSGFEVGDRVRVKASVEEPRYGWGDIKAGDVGVIRGVDGEELRIDFEDRVGWIGIASDMEHADGTPSTQEAQILTSEWDKVKGQDAAKRALREAVEYPITFAALYAAYKKRPSKGVMLYGPPGCGKTMLGRTLATAMGFGDAGFQYIKGSEIFGRFVGQEQEAIARHFKEAREYQKRTGKRKILFYDEAETIFQNRETGNNDGGHRSRQQAIARFLAEVDGLETSGAFVILASNLPHLIDTAVTREGRIDRKIKVDRPNREACGEILAMGFKEVPCASDLDPVAVALESVYDPSKCYAAIETDDRGTIRVCYHHTVSGAVMDGIVERTIANALDRDIRAGNTQPSGITAQDVKDAVEDSWRGTWDIDHRPLFEEVTGGVKPISIRVYKGKQMGVGSDSAKHEIEVKIREAGEGPELPGGISPDDE